MRRPPAVTPLLTGISRYDKSLSTRGRGQGTLIEAPIIAWLIETVDGRILYDVGCDYGKIADPAACARHYGGNPFGAPEMTAEQTVPAHLGRLGLGPLDVDLVFLGHGHFDHAGGLADFPDADIHIHADELAAARAGGEAYFAGECEGSMRWRLAHGDYQVCPGVQALCTPGHTAGHMSLLVECCGSATLIAGDAADLQENLDDEVAPGLCWQDRTDLAIGSIRRLKQAARSTGARLLPNHDMRRYRDIAGG
jgi:N-acyl homoserine lactone hydrolase